MGRFERRGRRAWKVGSCAEWGSSVEAGVAKPDVVGAEVGHVAVDDVRRGRPNDSDEGTMGPKGSEGMNGLKPLLMRVSDGDGMGRGASHPMMLDGRSRGVVPHVRTLTNGGRLND